MNKHEEKHIRVSAYVLEDDYKRLRSHLILQNKNVSEWIREKIEDYLIEVTNE